MDYKIYWVGERPSGALVITVADQETGMPLDISEYSSVKMHMLDGRNREVDLGNSSTQITNAAAGRVSFLWPSDKTLFERPGEYVFQLELIGGEGGFVRVRTTVENILVKRLGGTR